MKLMSKMINVFFEVNCIAHYLDADLVEPMKLGAGIGVSND